MKKIAVLVIILIIGWLTYAFSYNTPIRAADVTSISIGDADGKASDELTGGDISAAVHAFDLALFWGDNDQLGGTTALPSCQFTLRSGATITLYGGTNDRFIVYRKDNIYWFNEGIDHHNVSYYIQSKGLAQLIQERLKK